VTCVREQARELEIAANPRGQWAKIWRALVDPAAMQADVDLQKNVEPGAGTPRDFDADRAIDRNPEIDMVSFGCGNEPVEFR
jgi:hypothetical protein